MYLNYFRNHKLILLKRENTLFYLLDELIYLKVFATECAPYYYNETLRRR